MLLILLGEILMGVLAYRRAKANGTLPEPAPKAEENDPYVQLPLGLMQLAKRRSCIGSA